MSLLTKIADHLILKPTVHDVDAGDNYRAVIFSDNKVEIEAFVSTWGEFDSADTSSSQKLVVLKFPGTGGRAECGTVHPCELIIDAAESESRFTAAQVWTLNHRGYGNSTGPAALANFSDTVKIFWEFIEDRFPNETKIAIGNSLGCMSALFLAAHKPVDAIMLRNPPPIARLISDRPRYNVWNFGMAKYIAAQVPEELDAIANAGLSNCPALFVSSEKDRLVPPKYQREIMDAYAGESHQFIIRGADHDHRIQQEQESEYRAAIEWLRMKIE